MTDWDIVFGDNLTADQKSFLSRKHYFRKEPFSKVLMHEMHLGEMVDDMKETEFRIEIVPSKRQVTFYPPS